MVGETVVKADELHLRIKQPKEKKRKGANQNILCSAV